LILHGIANLWWLIFPAVGLVGGALNATFSTRHRRKGIEKRLDKYRAAQQPKIDAAKIRDDGYRREIAKLIDTHGKTDLRWFEYELDIAKLLDFPMMTDMRAPLTIAFHKDKQRADLLRPENPETLVVDRPAQLEYRDAVAEYASAFEIAESEAIRRRRSDFSEDEQQRMARAQKLIRLADDESATREERQLAYANAKKELEGLIVLPAPAREALEQRIAAQIEA
jgi:hypothetical protein